MDLYLLRHGKAQEHTLNLSGDAKRQLTEVGKREMVHIAKAIKNLDISADEIISSPLVRAKQTADIVNKHFKSRKKRIKIWNELKPEIEVKSTIKKLLSLKQDSSVLLVGHEPHLTSLISAIISDGIPVNISLKKGGFVHVRCDLGQTKVSGSLRSMLTPKQLKKLC